ncbi:MAG: dicarboxylate/amino acid:cation symporter [Proteobacteria bacterium]|uniref:dicarboxylate/amino acid:cation symporter n=1 Tax=Rudaea sp. TaxID=2136325 RepID=UPI00321FE095|nr:dicarboxylate/amino acid:cation symporter [Pseudomonadota bacterium]
MKGFTRHLYFWVLVGIVLGGLLGWLFGDAHPVIAGTTFKASSLKWLGDLFIGLVKMLISPVIFLTVVLGIAGMSDMKKVGRVGGKALLYFEIVSTVALGVGLLVMKLVHPGSGQNIDPATLDAKAVANYAKAASEQSTTEFILHIIPKTFVDAFTANGDLLQVLLIAILFGFVLSRLGETGQIVYRFFEVCSKVLFGMINLVMKVAPLGAFGAMAFTIGKYGVGTILNMAQLVGLFYLTAALFVVVVLGTIAHFTGFSILRFLNYIKSELLIVLGTSSSESALVPLMEKLERLGCSKSVVGLVVPSGYSFNLDGTNIYMTMASLYIAQALNIDLTWGQELALLGIAMLTSKGASGVTGAGFITLAATLAVVPSIPVAGMALILGVDRFMSECRALTNFIGNGVATIVVSKWEGELDSATLRRELADPSFVEKAEVA